MESQTGEKESVEGGQRNKETEFNQMKCAHVVVRGHFASRQHKCESAWMVFSVDVWFAKKTEAIEIAIWTYG